MNVRNQTLLTALIAVQGPKAVNVLAGLVDEQQRLLLTGLG